MVHVLRFVALVVGLMITVNQALAVDTGKVEIENNYAGSVKVRLYHADALDSVYGSWDLNKDEKVTLERNGQEIVIGGDWLIDIVFGNGVTSKRHLVAKVGNIANGTWKIKASTIENLK